MRFRSYRSDGKTGVAVQDGAVWHDLGPVDLVDLIAEGAINDAAIATGKPVLDMDKVTLLPVIPKPPKFICVGLNYVDHAAESPYKDLPTYPAFFPRFNSSLIGHEALLIRPHASHEFDYECELAVVIGKPARHVREEDALAHVAGYAIFNDGSLRNYQFLSVQWTPGKNFDGTGAFGPDLVTADELPAGASGLRLQTILNGEVLQSGNTADMIFPVAKLIAIASEFTTLETGTVIATGTPAGVGFARKPPIFMKEGDICEIHVEKLGVLRNQVRNEA